MSDNFEWLIKAYPKLEEVNFHNITDLTVQMIIAFQTPNLKLKRLKLTKCLARKSLFITHFLHGIFQSIPNVECLNFNIRINDHILNEIFKLKMLKKLITGFLTGEQFIELAKKSSNLQHLQVKLCHSTTAMQIIQALKYVKYVKYELELEIYVFGMTISLNEYNTMLNLVRGHIKLNIHGRFLSTLSVSNRVLAVNRKWLSIDLNRIAEIIEEKSDVIIENFLSCFQVSIVFNAFIFALCTDLLDQRGIHHPDRYCYYSSFLFIVQVIIYSSIHNFVHK